VLVDPVESPFEAREVRMHGLRQAPLGEVLFDSCRVPKRNLCPDTGETAKLLTLTWLANRPLVGLLAVGAGQKALDAARQYATTRKQFGRYIGGFQLVQNDLAEIETAVRRKLPFVAIVGNDACWNAESQLQRRHYGENRMHGCELLPARYDLLASALGGHGELVEAADQLDGAIARAIASGKPAVINVMTESIAAPVLGRGA